MPLASVTFISKKNSDKFETDTQTIPHDGCTLRDRHFLRISTKHQPHYAFSLYE